ncbi:MAG: DNA-directed RNA polymerase subunit alpha, partial [Clostridia bacterium]|nr:DNA-directed RNA polymerase subunit alpha [Clostridia bacterium]
MIEIEKPNITTVNLSEDGTSGKFIVDPLERGYGITLGNSLRRILLSSLPGVAVTSIKINGVLHEFSTVPGVKEDVTEIVLNVKGITAKLHCNAPKTVVIDVTGEKVVTAGDIEQDSDIEILNPDHHIATVGANERFYMELTFEHGRGYVSQERNKQNHTMLAGQNVSAPIGTIFTDSAHASILQTKYITCYTFGNNWVSVRKRTNY